MTKNSIAGVLRAVAIAGFCLLGFTLNSVSVAADSTGDSAEQTYQFDIPAGDLAASVERLGEITGLQIAYDPKLAAGKLGGAVQGRMSARQALATLLAGTGLTWQQKGERSVALKAARISKTTQASPVGPTPTGAEPSERVLVAGERPTYEPGGNVDIPRTINDVQPYYIFDSQTIEQSGALNVEDFLKQRLTMNAAFQSQDQVATVIGRTAAGGFRVIPGSTISTINLRGLGVSETLILVDGHRMASVVLRTQGGSQPDINGIPLAAIDRIEVLPSSASGIYGASALGGVINIILKKNYRGGDIRYSYEKPINSSASTPSLDAAYGFAFEEGRTHVILAGHYSDAQPLLVGDRKDLYERGVNTILSRAPSLLYAATNCFSVFPGGSTPNVAGCDANGQPSNLILKNGTNLGSPFAHIAPGTSPATLLTSALVPGSYNFNLSPGTGPYGLQQPMGNAARVKSFDATINRQMTSWLEAFAEVGFTENHGSSVFNPLTAVSPATFTLQSSDPGSPFQNPFVTFTFPANLALPVETTSTNRSITTGLIGKLPHGWTAEMDYTFSKNSFEQSQSPGIAGLGTAITSGVVNPFIDMFAYPPYLDPYIIPVNTYSGSSTVNDIALRASGPIFDLPWGSPTLTAGLEHRKEGYPANTSLITAYSPATGRSPGDTEIDYFLGQSESTDSLYSELNIPLVTAENSVWGVHSLDVQLAARAERFSVGSGTLLESTYNTIPPTIQFSPTPPDANADGTGGTPQHGRGRYQNNNATFGLKYQPVRDVTLRGSIATAFLPPFITQLLPNPQICQGCDFIFDPKTGTSYSVNTIQGGNPHVQPQHSRSWDAGLIFEPQEDGLKGLRIDLESYRIAQYDVITSLSGNQILSVPSLASRVTRDPTTGLITQIDETLLNAPIRKTQGWDLSADYRLQTAVGTFDLYLAWTMIQFELRQLAFNAPLGDYAGFPSRGGEAKDRANAALTWGLQHWTLGWATTYFGQYHQINTPGDPTANGFVDPDIVNAQGGNTVRGQVYHRLFVGYAFGSDVPAAGGVLSNTTLQLTVNDIFNTAPAFDAVMSPFYASPYGNLKRRDFLLTIRKQF